MEAKLQEAKECLQALGCSPEAQDGLAATETFVAKQTCTRGKGKRKTNFKHISLNKKEHGNNMKWSQVDRPS